MSSSNKKSPIVFLILLLLFLSGIALGFFLRRPSENKNTPSIEDPYLRFTQEVYEKIQQNYWEKITDEKLSTLFKLAAEKLLEGPQVLESQDQTGTLALVEKSISQKSDSEKKEFVSSLADVVLANLEPFGRSRLYTSQKEQELKNRVENVNPDVDQYETLGLEKDATPDQIEETYQKAKQELSQEDSSEARDKLAQIKNAYDTLKDDQARQTYDQTGIQTSIAYDLLAPQILHIHIKQFSPTTLTEFQSITQKFDQGDDLDTLILDLRDNVGGAIDGLPYLLGPFIGQDQYAYQFYHQGEKPDFKTQTGWLPSLLRYKKVLILANENTQSSAEVMAAVLKRYNVGVLLGNTTRGWGTVEKVFPLDSQLDPNETYSMFLVHSLTLRDDNQPIEGRGVDPLINIADPGWEAQLNSYLNYPELTRLVQKIWEE
jgi:hypothetical protein